jgi:hypothetical protein
MAKLAAETPEQAKQALALAQERAQEQAQAEADVRVARARAPGQTKLETLMAGKPWRQWSEDQMVGFGMQALRACVIKADRKEEQACLDTVKAISDDWQATR